MNYNRHNDRSFTDDTYHHQNRDNETYKGSNDGSNYRKNDSYSNNYRQSHHMNRDRDYRDSHYPQNNSHYHKHNSNHSQLSQSSSKPHNTINKGPLKIEGASEAPQYNEETDPARLAWRQKQIDFGKNTIGYSNYISSVPIEERNPNWRHSNHPVTPPLKAMVPKRQWEAWTKSWRGLLHGWDNLGGFKSNTEMKANKQLFRHITYGDDIALPANIKGDIRVCDNISNVRSENVDLEFEKINQEFDVTSSPSNLVDEKEENNENSTMKSNDEDIPQEYAQFVEDDADAEALALAMQWADDV